MLPKLEHIKQARIRLGVTQRKLASLANVSTSMINQIESGRCKPSYDTARRIFEVLGELEGKTSTKAGEICSRGLITVTPSEPVLKAAELMREKGFSQLPVVEDERPIGIISEEGIMREMMKSNGKDIGQLTVAIIREPCPPIVDAETPAKALIPLIKFCKSALIMEKQKLVGIVTASDVLRLIE